MSNYARVGECSWCGQCCGAPFNFGSADPNPQPWPQNYLIDRISWDDLSFAEQNVFGNYLDRQDLDQPDGNIKIGPTRYYWKWSLDGTWVKTDPQGNDYGQNGKQCPFLIIHRDDGYPSTPQDPCTECAVYGAPVIWTGRCGLLPQDIMDEGQVTNWQASHPACSFSWELQG